MNGLRKRLKGIVDEENVPKITVRFFSIIGGRKHLELCYQCAQFIVYLLDCMIGINFRGGRLPPPAGLGIFNAFILHALTANCVVEICALCTG